MFERIRWMGGLLRSGLGLLRSAISGLGCTEDFDDGLDAGEETRDLSYRLVDGVNYNAGSAVDSVERAGDHRIDARRLRVDALGDLRGCFP